MTHINLEEAIRELECATSLAIRLLSKLDTARSQMRTLRQEEDGRMIVCPIDCHLLNATVKKASRLCCKIKNSHIKKYSVQ